MEELLFGVLLALKELDVVDEQDVEVAVVALEPLGPARAQGANELVGEPLGGRIADAEAWGVGVQGVGDRAEPVRLSQTRRAMQEEGVVGLGKGPGDGEKGGQGG